VSSATMSTNVVVKTQGWKRRNNTVRCGVEGAVKSLSGERQRLFLRPAQNVVVALAFANLESFGVRRQ
jgi:hypothetical protein